MFSKFRVNYPTKRKRTERMYYSALSIQELIVARLIPYQYRTGTMAYTLGKKGYKPFRGI